MKVVTRFAPSPTGFLHIGGARTALFNYLFAKHHSGKFLLRIEDTDRQRSTKDATQAIIDGLSWLELAWDDDIVYQFSRSDLHAQAAKSLIESGSAYYCFLTAEELELERTKAIEAGVHYIIKSKWRDADPSSYPQDQKPVIRLKAPREGVTIIKDLVQGDVVVANDHLDDMVLLRSDGTPTYMLAVVVDDHDMGVTHIIRGDDHLTNAARQILLYQAFGWEVPKMAHIPLIHGSDGAKLSKRHGALGVEWYRDNGYLPEAICNYLLRLGWSHGNDEIISRDEAIEWFNLESIGKSPSRLDFDKMQNINMHYIKNSDDQMLLDIIKQNIGFEILHQSQTNILSAIESIKNRSHNLVELVSISKIYVTEEMPIISNEAILLLQEINKTFLHKIELFLRELDFKSEEYINGAIKDFAKSLEVPLANIMKPIRYLVTGMVNSPSVAELLYLLQKENTLKRFIREI